MPHLYKGIKMYWFAAYFTFQFRGEKGRSCIFLSTTFPQKGVKTNTGALKFFKVQTKLHDAQECAVAFLCLSME